MKDYGAESEIEVGKDADLLKKLISHSEQVLVKKLSNNDRDWAKFPNKHQAGIYIPVAQRDGGFFPELETKVREGAPIREAWVTTIWPQSRNEERNTRLVHYTSKGSETHLTGLPKDVFADLLPASFLIIGKKSTQSSCYECMTIDSASDEAVLLMEMLGFSADFVVGVFYPITQREKEKERILEFAEQVIAAWLNGDIVNFALHRATMPSTVVLANKAWAIYLAREELTALDPFAMQSPGDALREISRVIEWDLFREFQRRERAVSLVQIVLGNEPAKVSASSVIRRLVDELPAIDALMLSASQQRKSRAGYSFEHHIESMLTAANIPFEKQVIIEARKRPDFILPSLAFIDSGKPNANSGLILSAKTTLRERWKQVEREKGNRQLYLATVDENVAGNAIEDMGSFGVNLIIPESLLKAKETEYKGHKNVLTFRQFCHDVVRPAMSGWI